MGYMGVYGVYGDLIIIYPKPHSIHSRGLTGLHTFVANQSPRLMHSPSEGADHVEVTEDGGGGGGGREDMDT